MDHDLECPDEVWTHPSVHVQESTIAGYGLFAAAPLAEGVVVMRLGGRVVSITELHSLFAAAESANEYIDTFAIGEDRHIVLPRGSTAHYGNHSCDPTMWPVSAFELAIRRIVRPGEELTVDYGLISDDADFRMSCSCGTKSCRGLVTGQDWQRSDLRQRYKGHWPPGLQQRITVLEQTT